MGGTRFPRQIVVRVTDELFDLITADADRHGRSVSQTVRFRLEITYDIRDE